MEETPPVLEELEAELGSPPRLHLSHTEINVLQMTDGRLRQEYHALQAQLRAVQQERDDLLVRLKALETTHRNSEQRHKREIEELQRMMSAKEDEIDELKVQVSKLAAENTILKEKAKTNTEKLDQQGNDINYLRAQVEGLLRMIPSTNAKSSVQKVQVEMDNKATARMKLGGVAGFIERFFMHCAIDKMEWSQQKKAEVKDVLSARSQLHDTALAHSFRKEDLEGKYDYAFQQMDPVLQRIWVRVKNERNSAVHPTELLSDHEFRQVLRFADSSVKPEELKQLFEYAQKLSKIQK
eukprot:TRINITY_DN59901_c0_g1_i1.p1 TRINITY_DN59901_c0_g1~~TRINITY_DN59901_c0_g1_i1.p1  ORF type:complete len:296 (+),score=33.09 TRINITY_DN59901_c0_g1_i1:24-911(+)